MRLAFVAVMLAAMIWPAHAQEKGYSPGSPEQQREWGIYLYLQIQRAADVCGFALDEKELERRMAGRASRTDITTWPRSQSLKADIAEDEARWKTDPAGECADAWKTYGVGGSWWNVFHGPDSKPTRNVRQDELFREITTLTVLDIKRAVEKCGFKVDKQEFRNMLPPEFKLDDILDGPRSQKLNTDIAEVEARFRADPSKGCEDLWAQYGTGGLLRDVLRR